MEKEFWDKRWLEKQTGWDIGYPSPVISDYFESLSSLDSKILIPGCGNAYEAEFLNENGFYNTWIIDISEHAIESFKRRVPNFPKDQILCGDFFKLDDDFDFIIEQTFFCAIHPEKRNEYCKKVAELIRPTGALVGLLFDFPLDSGPPFGGTLLEYQKRFKKTFSEVNINRCSNSIEPRKGREFWIEMRGPIKS